MQHLSQRFHLLGTVIMLAIILQACSGSKVLSDDGAKEYAKNYNTMKTIVENAIAKSNFNIDFVSESESKDEMTLTVSRVGYINTEKIQREQGIVRIIKIDQNNTRVEIDNPEYHFSVPEHQREDYQRIIFMRIDDILGKG